MSTDQIKTETKTTDSYLQPLLLVGAFVIILLLWHTPLVLPLKIFVVLLHELSHGLAAALTGGSIGRIYLTADQGGVCEYADGWPLAVASAGYLGSMLWGGLILVAAARTRWDRAISVAIGAIVLLTTILFIRNLFGFAFGLLFGAALAALGIWAAAAVNDFVLKLVGLTSILYAIIDIYDDLIVRTVKCSDAAAMSNLLFGPPVLWGALWMLTAIGAAVFFLWLAVKKPRD